MSKIGLYINPEYGPRQGPYKVYLNLRKGLEQIGHEVVVNQPGELTGCLHDFPGALALPSNTLMGPNLFVLPDDRPEYYQRFRNFVVPSEWVKAIYQDTKLFNGHRIFTWSVGIDTDLFVPEEGEAFDCLLYYKNRSNEDLQMIMEMLRKYEQSNNFITYGNYDEKFFRRQLRLCRYAVLLTSTESQGIGYMECLSTNTPCFVLNRSLFKGKKEYPASSVPYFDAICGRISTLVLPTVMNEFEDFLANLGQYRPRDYILKNHTLAKSAERYVELLKECA